MRTRELHGHIRSRIELALGNRSWSWLSRATGVPQSTLSSQAAKPKFSVDVLVAVADALGREVSYFLPSPDREDVERTPSEDALARMRRSYESLEADAAGQTADDLIRLLEREEPLPPR